MKRRFLWAVVLLVPMAFYTLGLSQGHPRPVYSPSTEQNAWLHPQTVYHPDEFAYVGITYRMLLTNSLDPNYYHNPPLNIYTNLVLFHLAGAKNMPHHLEYGDREIAPFQLYFMARYMSALYSLLAATLVYSTGRLAFNRRAGIVAAALIAFSPLTVQHAHYATPNAQANLLATAVVFAAVMILKQNYPTWLPRWAIYLAGGLLVGLTMGARYNAVTVGLVIGLAMLTDWWHHRRLWPLVVGFAMMSVGFAIAVPGIVLATSEVVNQIRQILHWYQVQGGGPGFTADSRWSAYTYHWRYAVLFGTGPAAAVAAGVGIAVMLCRVKRSGLDAWFGIVFVIYLLVYTAIALPGKRLQSNLLFPLLVPLALLAGYSVTWLWNRWKSRRIFALGMATLLAWPLFISILLVYRFSALDNRLKAQEWVYQHIPRGTPIYLLGPYNVPIDPMDYPIRQTYAGAAGPDDVGHAAEPIIVYSDAYPFLTLHTPSFSDEASIAREKEIRHILETEWVEMARFKRWWWPGESVRPDDVSYWHQFEVAIYCRPENCPVAR